MNDHLKIPKAIGLVLGITLGSLIGCNINLDSNNTIEEYIEDVRTKPSNVIEEPAPVIVGSYLANGLCFINSIQDGAIRDHELDAGGYGNKTVADI